MINLRINEYIRSLETIPYGVVYEKNRALPSGVVFKSGRLNLFPKGFFTKRDISIKKVLPLVQKFKIQNYTGQRIITCSRGIFFVEKLPL